MEGTIGEVRLFAASFAPANWSYCNGGLVAIRSNTALFAILGINFGGDGQNTFALPDLRGRSAIGVGQGPGLTYRTLGEMGGVNNTTLSQANLAVHTHGVSSSVQVPAFSESGNSASGAGNILASLQGAYQNESDGVFLTNRSNIMGSISGSNQPVPITQPSLGMGYIVCMVGVFPQRPY